MIGPGLKKLAKENNMKISSGVAYGSLQGYAATLSEGAGYKKIAFSLYFADMTQKEQFLQKTQSLNLYKTYRVLRLDMFDRSMDVVFHDTIGTMKKIWEFLGWVIPLLDEFGATKVDICPACGLRCDDGKWNLINDVAHRMHDSCAEKAQLEIAENNTKQAQEAEGSYAMGALGAFLGAVVGAIAWAILLSSGYISFLGGLAIGFLVDKGYDLLHGKQSKGKLVVMSVCVLIGIVLGTFGPDVFTLITMIAEGSTNLTYPEIPGFLITLLGEDAEYRNAILYNGVMGLLFAVLSTLVFFFRAAKTVGGEKFKELK